MHFYCEKLYILVARNRKGLKNTLRTIIHKVQIFFVFVTINGRKHVQKRGKVVIELLQGSAVT